LSLSRDPHDLDLEAGTSTADPSSRASLDTTHLASPSRNSFQRSSSLPLTRTHSVPDLHDLSPLSEHPGRAELRELNLALNQHAAGGGVRKERREKSRQRHHHGHGLGHHKRTSSSHTLPSLLHEVLHPNIDIRPVGVVESQRYMDLEDYLHNPRDEEHIEEIIALLSKASSNLLDALSLAIAHLISTIHTLKANDQPWSSFFKTDEASHAASLAKTASVFAALESALSDYRNVRRLDVVKPFACLFDPAAYRGDQEEQKLEAPSHRGLFWCFSYEFTLMGWSLALLELFKEIAGIEKKRRKARLWTPEWAKMKFHGPSGALNEDERPTVVPGFEPAVAGFNRTAFHSARHPDYNPPSNNFHILGIKLYDLSQVFRRDDFWFGVKASLLIALVALPAYFRSTAYFFYKQRGVWVLIMAALTSQQYVGDTTFQFVTRVFGTFGGALVGLVIWYIGAGTGHGSPYGIAACCAVAFPLLMFFRLYYTPIPSAILPVVTSFLVIGYSWQDANQPALSSVGFGWDVAWRRFVCVLIGITAAWLWAYLPPKSTQKETVRQTYAKVIGETGGVLCQVLSFANCKADKAKPPKQILKNIAALRAKVAKTTPRKAMIGCQSKKWRGRPSRPGADNFALSRRTVATRSVAKRKLCGSPFLTFFLRTNIPSSRRCSPIAPTVCFPQSSGDNSSLRQSTPSEILDLLGQLLGVFASLDSKWTKALLHRGQLSDSRFLGEVLNTFQLISTALMDTKPLPFLYNPLLEIFLMPAETVRVGHAYGYDVAVEDAIPGIPLHVDLETICSIEYLRFSHGISQMYALVNRLDRLMHLSSLQFVAKSLVGENYIVYGMDEEQPGESGEPLLKQEWLGDESRRNSTDADE
ncbi:hypothetical protein P7C70_g6023, partial [Phenoliferia sp. Uapishka_3]